MIYPTLPSRWTLIPNQLNRAISHTPLPFVDELIASGAAPAHTLISMPYKSILFLSYFQTIELMCAYSNLL